jgi:hypothetical protein
MSSILLFIIVLKATSMPCNLQNAVENLLYNIKVEKLKVIKDLRDNALSSSVAGCLSLVF